MSSNDFLAAVTEIAYTNPNAYQFIIDLTNSENWNDVLDAIDTYDQTVLDAYNDVVAVWLNKRGLILPFLCPDSSVD